MVSGFLSVNRNGMSVLAIIKKLKKGCHFININCMEKCQITNPPPPKSWVSSFLSVDRNRISVSAIIKQLKNGHHFISIDHMENFKLLTPLKFGCQVFQVSTEMDYQCQPLWKNQKWLPFHKYRSYRKNSNYHPSPQSLGLWFSKCQQKWNISVSHYEKIKSWPLFCKYLLLLT